MFELPGLRNSRKKTENYIYTFRGIDKSEDYTLGELETSENAGFEDFPALGSGKERLATNQTADDMFYADGIIRTVKNTDGTVTVNIRPEGKGLWTYYVISLPAGKKEFAALNGNTVTFPDKKVLSLSSWRTIDETVSYSFQADQFISVQHNKIWFGNSSDFTTFNITFKAGDVLTCNGGYYVDGVSKSFSNKKLIVREISSTEYSVTFDPHSFDNAGTSSQASAMSFTKKVPSLSNLCVWNGRVWGVDTENNNNICASKYNDPTNYEYFDLSSADSFTLETETPGSFTGCGAMENCVIFFKENFIHRITGTKPSNYRHTVINAEGVKSGSERSVQLIDGILYYEGKSGIYAFNGSEARLISKELGNLPHSNGVSAVVGKVYCISFNSGDKKEVYCYDTEKHMWLRDGGEEKAFKASCVYGGETYVLGEDGKILFFEDKKAENTTFSVTLREIREGFSEQKGFTRLYLGYSMKQGGSIKVEVSYDGKAFERAGVFTDHRKTVEEIRLKPNRSDFIKIRLTATSDVVIRSLMREHFAHNSVR